MPMMMLVPCGFAAAMLAHALLQAIAVFGFGASEYASHAHSAVQPIAFVETALALWVLGFAVRDALTVRSSPHYAIASRPKFDVSHLSLWAGCISVIAIGTLFGMEYAECGSAAFGLGWLGGALYPGVSALVVSIASVVGVLYLALAGHLAGFDHLVALFAAALSRFFATLLAPAPASPRLTARALPARTAPVARHAGLRAPPMTTL